MPYELFHFQLKDVSSLLEINISKIVKAAIESDAAILKYSDNIRKNMEAFFKCLYDDLIVWDNDSPEIDIDFYESYFNISISGVYSALYVMDLSFGIKYEKIQIFNNEDLARRLDYRNTDVDDFLYLPTIFTHVEYARTVRSILFKFDNIFDCAISKSMEFGDITSKESDFGFIIASMSIEGTVCIENQDLDFILNVNDKVTLSIDCEKIFSISSKFFTKLSESEMITFILSGLEPHLEDKFGLKYEGGKLSHYMSIADMVSY